MQTIGIGELQKNMGILTHLTEPITIVDKRKGRDVAVAYPARSKQAGKIKSLAGKYRKYADAKNEERSFDEIRRIAMAKAMEERYGLAD